jgi:hypothetical protein
MVDLMLVWSKLELALRVHAAIPAVDMADALEHASAAVDASSPAIPADLLVSIAFIESRFDTTATSRVESGVRKTGHYPSTAPPRNLGGTLYCGPLQTYAASWSECIAMRVPETAYAAGVAELTKWLRDRRVRGNITLALAGHGCGNAGVLTGQCHNYPARVMWVRALLAHAMPKPKLISTRQCTSKGPCARTGVHRTRASARAHLVSRSPGNGAVHGSPDSDHTPSHVRVSRARSAASTSAGHRTTRSRRA